MNRASASAHWERECRPKRPQDTSKPPGSHKAQPPGLFLFGPSVAPPYHVFEKMSCRMRPPSDGIP